MASKVKKKPEKFNYTRGEFSVVKFYESDKKAKSFECIPDLWFIDEDKTLCFWPPKSKKSATWRAMNQDEPEDDWLVYECELISEGHVTYSAGSNAAREKASQNYNTSSADEHIQEAKFRREHPGLIHKGEKYFENLFAAAKAAQVHEKDHTKVSDRKKQETSNDVGNKESDAGDKDVTSKSPCSKSSSSHSRDPSKSLSNPRSNHSESIRSRSRSNHSQSDNSQARSNHSQARSNNSQTRSNHSQARSNNSQARSNHSHQHSNRSISNSTQSEKCSRSRSNNNSVASFQSRSYRSRSGISNSQSSRNRSVSRGKSYNSKSDNSQPRSKLSERHNRSQYSNYCSQSGSEKSQSSSKIRSSANRRYSEACTSSVQKTNRYNSARRQLSLRMDDLRRSSFSNMRERQNFNAKNNEMNRRDTYHQPEMHKITNNARQSENNARKNVSVSPRNRLRVEDRVASHSTITRNVRTVSSPNLSSRRSDSHHYCHQKYDSPELLDIHSSNDSTLHTLVKEVREIKKILTKNDRRFVESDRRLSRLEMTANKTFIILGDLSNAINARMLLGNALPRESKTPKGFHTPKMPIKRWKELVMVNRDLKNQDFFNYLVNCEKEFCCYSSSTDTATMTAYLRRFIDVDLKASIVLKDLKGHEGMTLYNDFHNVYLFLIETMKAGYGIKNKIISNKDVHVVLRTVWGRSKQAAEEANKKR